MDEKEKGEKGLWRWHPEATERVEVYLRPEEKERLKQEADAELAPLHEYIVYRKILTNEEKKTRLEADLLAGLESGESRPAEEVFRELRERLARKEGEQ